MRYSVSRLAYEYNEYLTKTEFDVNTSDISLNIERSHLCFVNSYNDYNYQELIKQYDKLYMHTDSLYLYEKFLKGE